MKIIIKNKNNDKFSIRATDSVIEINNDKILVLENGNTILSINFKDINKYYIYLDDFFEEINTVEQYIDLVEEFIEDCYTKNRTLIIELETINNEIRKKNELYIYKR